MSKTKSFKKIITLLGLLSVKEGYLAFKNVFGLLVHPFKTINEIKKERNYSQAIIVPSVVNLPFFAVSFLILLYLFFKYILSIYLPSTVGSWLKAVFLLVLAYITVTTIYIGYWLIKTKKYEPNS